MLRHIYYLMAGILFALGSTVKHETIVFNVQESVGLRVRFYR